MHTAAVLSLLGFFLVVPVLAQAKATMDFPVVKLRTLDKTSARTSTFEAAVGSTVKFGEIYIKVQACRKAPDLETPEAAAFLQIWQVTLPTASKSERAEWIFSGWMFASSPGLSAMDHPVYDTWVLDCLERKSNAPVKKKDDAPQAGEGEIQKGEEPVEPAIEDTSQND